MNLSRSMCGRPTKRPKGYLKVSSRKFHKWNILDQKKIFTLSKECSSTDEIIQKMGPQFRGIKKNLIYNQVRMANKAFMGLCYGCGEPVPRESLIPNKLFYLCNDCREDSNKYKKSYRKKHLKKHVCPYCGTNPLYVDEKGEHKACYGCLSISYRRRVKRGICGQCGKNPIDRDRSRALCTTCLNKQRDKL